MFFQVLGHFRSNFTRVALKTKENSSPTLELELKLEPMSLHIRFFYYLNITIATEGIISFEVILHYYLGSILS